ncbi:MAG: hypothetical protein V1492_04435 [Candidatus Micrarchaeota archaeon]
MDFNKIKSAAVLPTAVGIVIFILYEIVAFAAAFYLKGSLNNMLGMVVFIVLGILPYIMFFPVFIWTGFRAAKKYNAGLIEAGAAGTLTAALIAIAEYIIGILVLVITYVFFMGNASTSATATASTSLAVNSVLGLFLGMGLAIGAATCFAKIIISGMLNFMVAAVGWYWATGGKGMVIEEQRVTVVEMTSTKAKAKPTKSSSGRK